jgi:hypothetical protein
MSARSPTFSIVLPFRNPGVCFPLALKSVFEQTFEDWEVLLLDGGSTDGSLGVKPTHWQRSEGYCVCYIEATKGELL